MVTHGETRGRTGRVARPQALVHATGTRGEQHDEAARRRATLLGLAALSLTGLGRRLAADGNSEVEATQAAEQWLSLVDAGHSGASWDEAATLLRDVLKKQQWQVALAATRQRLGGLRSRRPLSRTSLSALPGVPRGEYCVIRYESDFEHKPGAVETITPMRDADGIWRVAGYFIR
jgi:hypothetical protein